MSKIFVDSEFARLWMGWSNRGSAHIAIKDQTSETFDISVGVGQGDSSSSAKYIMMHSVFVAALKSPRLQHLLFKLDNGVKLAPISFADDTLICMQLNDKKDVELLNEAFQCIG